MVVVPVGLKHFSIHDRGCPRIFTDIASKKREKLNKKYAKRGHIKLFDSNKTMPNKNFKYLNPKLGHICHIFIPHCVQLALANCYHKTGGLFSA